MTDKTLPVEHNEKQWHKLHLQEQEYRLHQLETESCVDQRLKDRHCATECVPMVALLTKYDGVVPKLEKGVEKIWEAVDSIKKQIFIIVLSVAGSAIGFLFKIVYDTIVSKK
jgi:hypothetical protein